jgi:hypothetical protein
MRTSPGGERCGRRMWHSAGNPVKDLRSVLHHENDRQRTGPVGDVGNPRRPPGWPPGGKRILERHGVPMGGPLASGILVDATIPRLGGGRPSTISGPCSPASRQRFAAALASSRPPRTRPLENHEVVLAKPANLDPEPDYLCMIFTLSVGRIGFNLAGSPRKEIP